jgi:hypothetical protein
MSEFKQYKRTNIAEMRPVTKEDIKQYSKRNCIIINDRAVSISTPDSENGSPKIGDMIARNPNDHNDNWLVAKKYFENNFSAIE